MTQLFNRTRQHWWIKKLAKLIRHGSAKENLIAAECYLEDWPESLNDHPKNHVEEEGCF